MAVPHHGRRLEIFPKVGYNSPYTFEGPGPPGQIGCRAGETKLGLCIKRGHNHGHNHKQVSHRSREHVAEM